MISENTIFRAIMVVAVLLSVGGVVFAVRVSGNAADGARGGAIADGIALVALFVTRNYAADLYYSLTRDPTARIKRLSRLAKSEAASVRPITAEEKIAALEIRLELDGQGQREQNICLAIATAVGTLFWGFGDIFAKWFI